MYSKFKLENVKIIVTCIVFRWIKDHTFRNFKLVALQTIKFDFRQNTSFKECKPFNILVLKNLSKFRVIDGEIF